MYPAMPTDDGRALNHVGVPYTTRLPEPASNPASAVLTLATEPAVDAASNQLAGADAEYRRVRPELPVLLLCERLMVAGDAPGSDALTVRDADDTAELPYASYSCTSTPISTRLVYTCGVCTRIACD